MKIHEICFSPTGGTRRVAEILSQALANEIVPVDLTARDVDFRSVKLADGDVALIAVPLLQRTGPCRRRNTSGDAVRQRSPCHSGLCLRKPGL